MTQKWPPVGQKTLGGWAGTPRGQQNESTFFCESFCRLQSVTSFVWGVRPILRPAVSPKPLDSITEMYAALRACWTPPPKDEARQGMEYTIRFAFRRDGEITAPPRRTYSSREASDEVRNTYRDAVDAALKRRTPLHFSKGMAGAAAGRPIAIRFVDERTLANSIDKAKSMQ
jgi:hypothetical protein